MWQIIKISFLVILGIILILVALEIRQDNPRVIINTLLKKGRLEGNKLTFKAKFLGVIPAGIATWQNQGRENFKGRAVYHLTGQGQSAKWLQAFFKAEANVDSYLDKDKLYSLEFRQHLIISDHPTEDKVIIYDQDNLIMDIAGEKRQILPNTHDPLSLMFYLQSQTFSIGREFDLNINTNQKNYQFKAKVLEKKSFGAANKKIDAWIVKAEVRRRDKSSRHSSTVTLYLLDNPTKIPILVKVMTDIGPITVRLIEVSY